ncbi:PKD domain-containing protein [Chryseosolibacter indicus]|uniref:PKD domain-containing protein n=1 Tax=Chryseosolibacter indicus TaxID=2782351 RepID=A0ABS5VKR9_9BACT|nr:PKD domain-containing protein [Chryseosolibacter indicus]MBT1702042.1 PKD domain-containing protein [Chryseosolibacter indicus]
MKQSLISIGIIIQFLVPFALKGQNVSADFEIKSEGCIGETIQPSNLSTGAVYYEWDICQGDLQLVPSGNVIGSVSGTSVATGTDIVYNEGKTFVFIASRDNHSIIRLELNDDQSKIISSTIISGVAGISSPVDIKIVTDNGKWYGFIYNEGLNTICRLDFGNSLTNVPISAVPIINSKTSTSNQGLDLIRDGGFWYIAYTFNSKVGVIKLNTIESIPSVADQFLSDNLSGNPLGDIKAVLDGENLYAFTISYGQNALFKLSFGNQPLIAPQITDLSSSLIPSLNYYGIDVGFDDGQYNIFTSTLQGSIIRILQGETLSQAVVKYESLGNLGVFTNTVKNRLVKIKGQWCNFSIDYTNGNLFKATFPNPPCENPIFITDQVPTFDFKDSGKKTITLSAYDNNGWVSEKTKFLSISSLPAPDLALPTSGEYCVGTQIEFSYTSNQLIQQQSWNFGDGTTNNASSVSYTYLNKGNYTIRLNVTAENNCSNVIWRSVSIFDAPAPDFTLPTNNPLCTSQQLIFNNTSAYDPGSSPLWQWLINGEQVSTSEDLNYALESTDPKEIKLVASIPGCSSETTKTINTIYEGPSASFNHVGNCEGEEIRFTNTSHNAPDQLVDYQWNIAGDITSDVDPVRVLFNGIYNVSLTAKSANGCENLVVHELIINSNPVADFRILNSLICNNSPTDFIDQTLNPDTPLATWKWNFGDQQTSNLQNPRYSFTNAGDNIVSLEVIAASGCSSRIQKIINVKPSPDSVFIFSPTCRNIPVSFNGPGASNILAWTWEVADKIYSTKDVTHTFRNPGAYLAKLTTKSTNGCEGVHTENLIVPVPLEPSYQVIKNCVDQPATFSDLTSGADPVVSREWLINENVKLNGSSANHTFKNTGQQQVQFTVTAASGCTYILRNTIDVTLSPKASFTTTQTIGAPPAEIAFTNTSQNASLSHWIFGDAIESNETSPLHVYTTIGNFRARLRSYNEQGCEDFAERSITISPPSPNVSIKAITTTENPDGTMKILITLDNEGNTVLKDLPVDIDVSGRLNLREVVKGPILPLSRYNLSLSYGLQKTGLEFLCAQAALQGDEDSQFNKTCIQLDTDLIFFPAFPNPTSETLNVEWISADAKSIKLSLFNALGVELSGRVIESKKGFNSLSFKVESLQNGIYLLVLKANNYQSTQRILISK